jgi:hypothetical protein
MERRAMTLSQYLPAEGSRSYVAGTKVAPSGPSPILTVADLTLSPSEKERLGEDARQSDSRSTVSDDDETD